MKRLVLLAALLAVVLLPVTALASPMGVTGTLNQFQSSYNGGNGGGEFTVWGYVGLTNADYGTAAKNVFKPQSFQTFCIETDEHTGPDPTYFRVNSMAVAGGAGLPDPDPISKGTAWLYSKFATGNLNVPLVGGFGNYFSAAGPSRGAEAGKLQEAIWALESETAWIGGVVTTANNAYYAQAYALYGASMTDNAAVGYLGVYVLNTWADKDMTVKRQDFTYYVPDGGTTLALLGCALIGLGVARRRFNA